MRFGIQLPSWIFPTWSRNRSGSTFSDITEYTSWSKIGNNLNVALDHPILSPALLFVAKLFSQAELKVIRLSDGGEVPSENQYSQLLRDPSAHLTQNDFLEALLFTSIANGVGVVYKKKNAFTGRVNALYVLDYMKLVFPDNFNKGNLIDRSAWGKRMKTKIKYDPNGENLDILLEDLMFFYDMPPCVEENPYITRSRIDGLKQTLRNTNDSLIAKNIILKSNGKEIISGTNETIPISPDEKKEIERLYNSKYGLAHDRQRGIVVSSKVNHKSLHIALRDLGLDDSIKVDGNMIYTALHIPKDIISLEAKKTTYNNFKESMVSYIQNELQPTLDSYIEVLNKFLMPNNLKVVGTYEHLPIMQFILIERYQGVYQRALSLWQLRMAGLPDSEALKLVGLDENIKLGPIGGQPIEPVIADQSGEEELNEQKVRDLIEEML